MMPGCAERAVTVYQQAAGPDPCGVISITKPIADHCLVGQHGNGAHLGDDEVDGMGWLGRLGCYLDTFGVVRCERGYSRGAAGAHWRAQVHV